MSIDNNKAWYEKCAIFKENKAIVKLKDKNGNFLKSVIIPTAYYPLNGAYEIFHHQNTERVLDEEVLKTFDEVKPRIGFCYHNAMALAEALKRKGYDAKTYVGWLFTGSEQFPVHHSWVVLNQKHVLDLSDDFTMMFSGENANNFKNVNNDDDARELIASFTMAARKQPNSVRCNPVGTPTPFLLYVGCECDAEIGMVTYQKLIKEYPDHECHRNCDKSGYNPTQRLLKDVGLME